MYCINEHFLSGCHFDEAYPNPCHQQQHQSDDTTTSGDDEDVAKGSSTNEDADREEEEEDEGEEFETDERQPMGRIVASDDLQIGRNFTLEQQMKLRNIASHGKLFDILMENTLLSKPMEPIVKETLNSPEKIVVYLLFAMVTVTIVVTIAMILLIINWTRTRASQINNNGGPQENDKPPMEEVKQSTMRSPQHQHHYLSNQQHHHNTHTSRHPYLQSSSGSRSRHGDNVLSDRGKVSVVVSKGRRHNRVDSSAL